MKIKENEYIQELANENRQKLKTAIDLNIAMLEDDKDKAKRLIKKLKK